MTTSTGTDILPQSYLRKREVFAALEKQHFVRGPLPLTDRELPHHQIARHWEASSDDRFSQCGTNPIPPASSMLVMIPERLHRSDSLSCAPHVTSDNSPLAVTQPVPFVPAFVNAETFFKTQISASSSSTSPQPSVDPSHQTTEPVKDGANNSKVPALTEEIDSPLRKLAFLAEIASATLENNNKQENDSTKSSLQDTHEIVPTANDVIFGKGGRLKHPGNETFRAECQRVAPQFLENPTSTMKHEVAQKLVRFVYERGGQFLVEDRERKGKWKHAGFDLACKKARQLLADAKKKSAGPFSLRLKFKNEEC